MASATPPPPHVAVLVDCPPPIYDDDGAGRPQQRRVWTNNAVAACKKACAVVCPWVALVLVGAAVVTGSVFLFGFSIHPLPPVYTVAITAFTGLDSARDVVDPPTTSPPASSDDGRRGRARPPTTTTALLSPVFNLTFQIDNTGDSGYSACVPGLSRAEVSYGGAFLAGGDVPPFCAADGENRTGGSVAVARPWGYSGVAVPRILWDHLAAELAVGDASVDVKVTMPTHCVNCGGGAMLSCKPKIGGGPSPACRLSSL